MSTARMVGSGERGAVLEFLLIGMVVIGAAALIAWRYIEADKAQNEADRAASGLSQAVISERLTRLQIPEAGISVRYDNANGPLTYRVDKNDRNAVAITLRNETFRVSDPKCAEYNATYQDIAVIEGFASKRSGSTETAPLLTTGGKYFYLTPMKAAAAEGGSCTDTELLKKRSRLFPSIFLQS